MLNEFGLWNTSIQTEVKITFVFLCAKILSAHPKFIKMELDICSKYLPKHGVKCEIVTIN
jgi:hypothetical protein